MTDCFFLNTDKIELKEEGEDSYVLGYISTKDKDLVNDVVTDDCLKSMFNQMKSRTIKFDVEHESFRGKSEEERAVNKTLNPIAKMDWFGIDGTGLLVKARLNKYHQRFNEVKGSIQDGFLDAFSIAYIPTKTKEEKMNGEDIRRLDDVRLLNVAFTGNPINEKASFTEVVLKSMDAIQENHIPPEREVKSKVIGMTEEKPEAKPEKPKPVEVKGTDKLDEISASLKSIEERLSNLEKKGEEGGDAEPEKGEPEKEPEKPEPALKDELKSIRDELKELKSAPQYKAVQEDMKKELAGNIGETPNPLSYI